MNIFAVDPCPLAAARQLCNRHSSRMPLETAGMLAYAFPQGEAPIHNDYSGRHYKHPASIWVRGSKANFEWTLLHGLEQCAEYTRRYKREHDSEKHINWFINNYSYLKFSKEQSTPFARCFGPYKLQLDLSIKDTVTAYREFYHLDKKDFAKWPSEKHIPEWWRIPGCIDKNFKDGCYTKR